MSYSCNLRALSDPKTPVQSRRLGILLKMSTSSSMIHVSGVYFFFRIDSIEPVIGIICTSYYRFCHNGSGVWNYPVSYLKTGTTQNFGGLSSTILGGGGGGGLSFKFGGAKPPQAPPVHAPESKVNSIN